MPTVAVVESVAAVRGVEESALPPLGAHVDPDALNRLFDGRHESSARVEFTYAGCEVRVESDGTICVRPAGDA